MSGGSVLKGSRGIHRGRHVGRARGKGRDLTQLLHQELHVGLGGGDELSGKGERRAVEQLSRRDA